VGLVPKCAGRGEIQFGWDKRDFKDKREEIIGGTKIIAREGFQGVIEKT